MTGPSPTDRAKSGPAIHLATDARGLPLGAVVTAANVNDGTQTRAVLEALVVRPPDPDRANLDPDPRDLPRVRGDGGDGRGPARRRAAAAGFRRVAPRPGQPRRSGVGRVRSGVERGHALLAQLGRVGRRSDRNGRRYLAWVELAAALIFIRHQANGFFR